MHQLLYIRKNHGLVERHMDSEIHISGAQAQALHFLVMGDRKVGFPICLTGWAEPHVYPKTDHWQSYTLVQSCLSLKYLPYCLSTNTQYGSSVFLFKGHMVACIFSRMGKWEQYGGDERKEIR